MMTGAKVFGPAIAGVLITTLGVTWCFVINALSYLPQLALFARLDRSRFHAGERITKAKGQLREGFRYMWRTPELRLPRLLVAAIGTTTFTYPLILTLFATRDQIGRASCRDRVCQYV